MKWILALLTVTALGRLPAAAQPSAENEVLQPVYALFEAMEQGDSAAVRGLFLPGARLASVGAHSDHQAVRFTNLEAFVNAVGAPRDIPWRERPAGGPEVRINGELAAVWLPYRFFVGERLAHCGIDAIHLSRTPSGWRILHLSDSRIPAADCPAPTE